MNTLLATASVLLAIIGLVHTMLGEILIFRRLRKGGVVPTEAGSALRERQVRILWATWHAVSVLGWAMAAALWQLARTPVAVHRVGEGRFAALRRVEFPDHVAQ